MNYMARIGIFTLILIDVIERISSFEWALVIALPIGMLLFSFRDDVEAKEANKKAAQKRPVSRQA
ncbi:hypothetical protein [Enterococcus asini]|uniref:hypothetical protein n=1 Tax=Enterococcus asini TaxID=57732 RepID=UPI0026DA9D13|nr:hypothetical protein [Enterococcus asini]